MGGVGTATRSGKDQGGRNPWDNRRWNVSGPGLPRRCWEAATASTNARRLQLRAMLPANPCGQLSIIHINETGTAAPAGGQDSGRAVRAIRKDETLVLS